MMKIIVAYTKHKRVIGNQGKLPWKRIQGDLPRFKSLTLGSSVIMGRKTWETLPENLPERVNVVITHTPGRFFQTRNFRTVSSFPEACAVARSFSQEIFVIGGESIYVKALMSGLVEEVLATEVHQEYPGDRFFPRLTGWKEVSREEFSDHDFVTYKRE